MRRIVFHAEAFADFIAWAKADPVLFERITRLIEETARDPLVSANRSRCVTN